MNVFCSLVVCTYFSLASLIGDQAKTNKKESVSTLLTFLGHIRTAIISLGGGWSSHSLTIHASFGLGAQDLGWGKGEVEPLVCEAVCAKYQVA